MAGDLIDRSGFAKTLAGGVLFVLGIVCFTQGDGWRVTVLGIPVGALGVVMMVVGGAFVVIGLWGVVSLPQATWTEHELTVRTPALARWLTLGAVDRKVIVDRRAQFVFVNRRSWWLPDEEAYPFRAIQRVDQTFQGGDTAGTFAISLLLKAGQRTVPLFRLRAEFGAEGSSAGAERSRALYEKLRDWIIPPLGQSSGGLPIISTDRA